MISRILFLMLMTSVASAAQKSNDIVFEFARNASGLAAIVTPTEAEKLCSDRPGWHLATASDFAKIAKMNGAQGIVGIPLAEVTIPTTTWKILSGETYYANELVRYSPQGYEAPEDSALGQFVFATLSIVDPNVYSDWTEGSRIYFDGRSGTLEPSVPARSDRETKSYAICTSTPMNFRPNDVPLFCEDVAEKAVKVSLLKGKNAQTDTCKLSGSSPSINCEVATWEGNDDDNINYVSVDLDIFCTKASVRK